MIDIIQILGFACLGHLITDFISSFDLPELPEKPFKCDMCLTFWLSIGPLMFLHGFTGILYASISAVVANYIYKYK
tara:strand:+ start:2830 stop:3057 length:228 start_codon:yes stop_codon:yes gene_type:complete